jgi:gliding motility-associated-like protein
MKRVLLVLLILASFIAKADHITGGEMFYTYTGFSNGLHHYNVTLKFFMRCNSGRAFNDPTVVSVFDKTNNSRVTNINVRLANRETISITNPDPCITNPPPVCYEVGYYAFTVSVPPSANGYTLASQVNYRISGINNFSPGYSQIGATYTSEIPGNAIVANAPENTSARFTGSDLVVVCANNNFNYSFAAVDEDGDQLRYSFCNAYRSSVTQGGNAPTPTQAPPFESVPYSSAFSGSNPLGTPVINPTTGLITGIAPGEGAYVVTVCVEEIRNGVVIATQRKDLQLNIAPCTVAGAVLLPEYMLCKSTRSLSISNISTSPLIRSQNWEIRNNQNVLLHTSEESQLNYAFVDTGTFTVKLIINRNGSCSDSTTSLVYVYPGFIPNFTVDGICFKRPSDFKDATTTVYGRVNGWQWDFGENEASSKVQNPSYSYNALGEKSVQLIVRNINGCRDTIQKKINIIDKPELKLLFRDSLICSADNIQLKAEGRGLFSWSPSHTLNDHQSATPIASPKITTRYKVTLNDNGCINSDSLTVRVVDIVQLKVMPDTTICQGDTIQLRLTSDGFTYSWTPAAQVDSPQSPQPFAKTKETTRYEVTANIGSCSATSSILVKTVPYPLVNAGNDTTICYDTPTQLSGNSDGQTIIWSPQNTLNNSRILNPIAKPLKTTAYTLTVFDSKGCPKPSKDTVIINVLADIDAFAGRDTAVLVGQPLQFFASRGAAYNWSPSTGLSSNTIFNPIGTYMAPSEGIRYKLIIYNEEGCADSAYINVKVFSTKATVFVPTAFTPNGDLKNDVIRPIAVGIKQLEYFRIYNRWGQLVFTTTTNGQGWDGKINGQPQVSSVYVWVVKAMDYTGQPYFQKGSFTLIR